MNFLETFKERGFFKQTIHADELNQRVNSTRICAYIGFDPTADTLHIGHLIPLMGLAHLQRSGQRVIALMGGGTAMIGDPSGKTKLRKIQTETQLEKNVQRIKPQMEHFLDFSGDSELINNTEWLRNLNYIDFLRDIGRHFSVNRMLSFETYKARLETGLTFLEFNYQLLQAYDFLELSKRFNCILQMGGDDQWANIIAGVDLIRRVNQSEAFGLTYPLLTTASGRKMGKTEKGTVWLDPEKTSSYEYYQYWSNIDDADVEKFLALFTFLPMPEIRELAQLQGAEIREAKVRLAMETTRLVHGDEEARKCEKTSQSLFDGGAFSKDVPTSSLNSRRLQDGIGIFDAFRETGLCKSNGEARRLLNQGGLYVNNVGITDQDFQLSLEDLNDGVILLRVGKKRYHRLVFE